MPPPPCRRRSTACSRKTDPDWQALVVDDGSCDETPRLIAAYTARDARIVGLRSSVDGACVGVSTARNRGLAAALGQRVLFLDSDDWVDAQHLQILNAALDAHPGAVAAYCNHHRVMADGALAPARGDRQIAVAPMTVFARTCGVAIHAVIVDRAAAVQAGGFDPALTTCEDWDLWQRVARQGGGWVHVDAALAFYRASEHSLSRDVDRLMADAAVVIARGHADDDRMATARVIHRHGADDDGHAAATAQAYFALWCAAFDCGRGRDGQRLAPALLPLAQAALDATAVVSTLLDGVMVGSRSVPHQLAARWSVFGAPVSVLIAAFATPLGFDVQAVRQLQYAFERWVLEHDDLSRPRPLALTLGVRCDLRRPSAVPLPPGVDRVFVAFCDGDGVLDRREFDAIGTVSPRRWLEWAAASLGRRRVFRLAAATVARNALPRGVGPPLRAVAQGVLRRDRGADIAWQALLAAAGPSNAVT